jgi:hypothetical protein
MRTTTASRSRGVGSPSVKRALLHMGCSAMFNRFVARAVGVAVVSALLAACGTGPSGTSTIPSAGPQSAGLQSAARAVDAATPRPTPTPCGYCPPLPQPHACPQLCSQSTQRETSAVATPSPTPRPPCYCPPNPHHVCPDIACIISVRGVEADAVVAFVRRSPARPERRLG